MPSIKKIKYSSKAKKDLKRYRHDLSLMRSLHSVLYKLSVGQRLPKENKPHKLSGNFNGFWECHVKSDFLLIWVEEDYIEVIRLGSHSELFE